MPANMRRGVHTSRLLCVMSLLPGVAAGQARGSLAVGAGRVHYEDSIRFSSAAISPAFEFDSPTLTANLWGTFASLPFGRWSSQGRADLWTVTPPAFGGLRLGVETIGAGTIRTDGGWSAAAHGIAEVLWAAPRWGIGVGAGPSAGWIAGAPSVTALHTRGRMWARIGAATYSVSAEPTRFLGAWFTDVSAAVALSTGPVTTSLWASRRLSTTYGSRSAGSALVQVFPTSTVAIGWGELSAGALPGLAAGELRHGGHPTVRSQPPACRAVARADAPVAAADSRAPRRQCDRAVPHGRRCGRRHRGRLGRLVAARPPAPRRRSVGGRAQSAARDLSLQPAGGSPRLGRAGRRRHRRRPGGNGRRVGCSVG